MQMELREDVAGKAAQLEHLLKHMAEQTAQLSRVTGELATYRQALAAADVDNATLRSQRTHTDEVLAQRLAECVQLQVCPHILSAPSVNLNT